jgi:hypothetical protein
MSYSSDYSLVTYSQHRLVLAKALIASTCLVKYLSTNTEKYWSFAVRNRAANW